MAITLVNSEGMEVVKYPPQKRTVIVAGKYYFLQFPYTVFAKVDRGNDKCTLHFAFARESDDFVYFPPFAHVEGSMWSVCMGAYYQFLLPYGAKRQDGLRAGSFVIGRNLPLKDLVEGFWATSLNPPSDNYFVTAYNALVMNYGRYHDWARLTLPQVLNKTQYKETPFKDRGEVPCWLEIISQKIDSAEQIIRGWWAADANEKAG